MQKAILEGKIGEKFGREWPINGCNSVGDTLRLIDCQTQQGLTQYLVEAAENNVDFAIQRGIDFIGEEELLLSIGKEDLIITEIPAGQKSGWAKVLAAIALIVVTAGAGAMMVGAAASQAAAMGATIAVGQTGMAAGLSFAMGTTLGKMAITFGINLALQGVTQMMTKGPETDKAEANKGYLFNGPVNTTQQGLPVPVAYGELVVGGAVISTSFQSSKFPSPNQSAFSQTSRTYSSTAYGGQYGSGELYNVRTEDDDPQG